jgi:O-antigen ligase
MRIIEEPHNTYVKALLTYGWMGGLAYFALVWMTLKIGIVKLFKPSANRLLLIPLVANFIPLAIESAIIDTDHWRHFFLLAGMIWGVVAGYKRTNASQQSRHGKLI